MALPPKIPPRPAQRASDVLTLGSVTFRVSRLEYIHLTPSDGSALHDLHLHFYSGGYARVNNLSASDLRPLQDALDRF